MNNIYAATKQIWTAHIDWNYNWLLAKVTIWSVTYVLAVPSIIWTEVWDLVDIINNNRLTYDWYSNLWKSYSWTTFDINWSPTLVLTNKLLIYTWSLGDLEDPNKQIQFVKDLQIAYYPTSVSDIPKIQNILDIDPIWNPEWTKFIAQTLINTIDPSLEVTAILTENSKILSNWLTYNTCNTSKVLCSNLVYSIYKDTVWNMWFWTARWVSNFDWDSTWVTYTTPNLVNNLVYSIYQDTAWNMWFGTWQWISKYDWSTWTNYTVASTSPNWLVDDYVKSIKQDTAWNMWFWTAMWVSRFDWTTWTNYTTANSDLLNNNVYSVFQDTTWNMWFGTQWWVNKFDWTAWTSYTTSNSGLGSNLTRSISQDTWWNMWFDASKFDWATWTNYTTPNIVHNSIYAVYWDIWWNVWVGTYWWISKYNWSTWESFTITNSDLTENSINSIFQDTSWDMWFGTEWWWLNKFDWTIWTSYTTPDINDNYIQSVYQDAAWNMWFGTYWWISKFY